MPSVSKIPQKINRYAIKEAYKIRNLDLEYAKGLDYTLDKITAESKLQKGLTESIN